MTAAVRFQVVESGARRVVTVSPATRPDLRLPVAHPSRPLASGRSAKVASCVASRPAAGGGWWLGVKVALVGLVAVAGAGVAGVQIHANVTAEPPAGVALAGDPVWVTLQP